MEQYPTVSGHAYRFAMGLAVMGFSSLRRPLAQDREGPCTLACDQTSWRQEGLQGASIPGPSVGEKSSRHVRVRP